MGFETLFLLGIVLVAVIIMVVMIIAVIVVMRKPSPAAAPAPPPPNLDMINAAVGENEQVATPDPSTYVPTPQEDIETYLAEQRANLAEFELKDLSHTFKGTTNNNQRKGALLHLSDPDTPLIAFTSQAFNAESGTVTAETFYGKMELIVAQGKAGVQWQGEPLGILDFSKQRMLDPDGRLLGSIEWPTIKSSELDYYPVSFFGQVAGEVVNQANGISTLRWFGAEEAEPLPAFRNLADDLEDEQTLLMLAALVLEVGFFDLL